jgi:hypothetical protein
MGIVAELVYILNTVSCCSSGSEMGCTNIDGISAMVDGSYATFQILCRG